MVGVEISCANLRNKRGKYGQGGKPVKNNKLSGRGLFLVHGYVGHETP